MQNRNLVGKVSPVRSRVPARAGGRRRWGPEEREEALPDRQDRYDAKFVRILRDACEIFARRGYHNTSVRDIAAGTGVSPAGLYYYFRSKEELLFLILDHTLASLLKRLEEGTRGTADPNARIHHLILAHLVFFSEHGKEMRVLVQEWEALTGDFAEAFSRRQDQYEGLVVRVLLELSPDTPEKTLRASAMGLLGMLAWTHRWYRPDRDLPVDALAERFGEIFLRGFLSVSGSSAPEGRGSVRIRGESARPRRGDSPPVMAGPGF